MTDSKDLKEQAGVDAECSEAVLSGILLSVTKDLRLTSRSGGR